MRWLSILPHASLPVVVALLIADRGGPLLGAYVIAVILVSLAVVIRVLAHIARNPQLTEAERRDWQWRVFLLGVINVPMYVRRYWR